MGVSAVGARGLSMSTIRSTLIVFAVFFAFGVYFYGPPVTPGLRAAATEACNEYAGGNFRSFRLSWESGPGESPHWRCWDARRPTERPVNLGWWVNPWS